MAEQIRLESYQTFTAPDVNTGSEKIGQALASGGKALGAGLQRGINEAERQKEEAQKKAEAEQKKAEEQQVARDRIIATDRLGNLQRDYERQVHELERTFVGSKSSKEYEEAKKNIFDKLMAKESKNLNDTVAKEMQKSGKSWLNSRLLSDLEKSYKEETEMANEAASSVANNALGAGVALGKDGNISGAQVAYGMTREQLKNFADAMAENSDVPVKEFDANYMMAFLNGVARSDNPDLAWDLSKPENLASFMGKDYEKDKSYFDSLSTNLQKHLEKPIEYGKNLLARENKQAQDQQKISDAVSFMQNPVLFGSLITREDVDEALTDTPAKKIKEAQKEMYLNSGKVGDGNVSVNDLYNSIRQVTSITVDPNGNVDNELLKAYYGYNDLVDKGASPEQLQAYTKVVSKALTDKNFKQEIATMAGKPSFDILFNKTTPTSRTSKQEKMDEYVNEIGRDALVGFMDLMASGDRNGAYDYYDQKFREAYDYTKSDILDVDYVKKNLEKMGYAMVKLNGNMTKIVGRDQNGEFIIEKTGSKINGGY